MTFTDSYEKTSTLDIDYGGIVWYIKEVCGGMDLHTFDEPNDARSFGHAVRENCPELEVEINYLTVRLRLRQID